MLSVRGGGGPERNPIDVAKGFCQGANEGQGVIGGMVGVKLVGDVGDNGGIKALERWICIGVG